MKIVVARPLLYSMSAYHMNIIITKLVEKLSSGMQRGLYSQNLVILLNSLPSYAQLYMIGLDDY